MSLNFECAGIELVRQVKWLERTARTWTPFQRPCYVCQVTYLPPTTRYVNHLKTCMTLRLEKFFVITFIKAVFTRATLAELRSQATLL